MSLECVRPTRAPAEPFLPGAAQLDGDVLSDAGWAALGQSKRRSDPPPSLRRPGLRVAHTVLCVRASVRQASKLCARACAVARLSPDSDGRWKSRININLRRAAAAANRRRMTKPSPGGPRPVVYAADTEDVMYRRKPAAKAAAPPPAEKPAPGPAGGALAPAPVPAKAAAGSKAAPAAAAKPPAGA